MQDRFVKNKNIEEFKKKYPKYKNKSNDELKDTFITLFSHFGDELVEKQDGIILNGIGYFCNAVFLKRKINDSNKETFHNFHTDGYIYRSTLYTYVFKSLFMKPVCFNIARDKARKMARMIIDKGMRYKCHNRFVKRTNKKNRVNYINDKV